MPRELTRRELLAGTGAVGAVLWATEGTGRTADAASPWPLALNASTIRPAPLEDKIRIAAEAGYDGIELWTNELERYAGEGKSLDDLRKRIADRGLSVPNTIGLGGAMPGEEEKRPAALEAVRRRLDVAAKVGAECIAAPPSPDREDMDVLWVAERYKELLAIGREFGVRVALEFLAFFKGFNRLGKTAAAAIETDERDACLVPDVFHMFLGGSGFNGIRYLHGDFIAVLHINDAPAEPRRAEQRDQHRVYPGDGILPLVQLLRDLKHIGFRGALSLELFNRDYWQQEPMTVARTGIEKMREVIAKSDA
ncbi:MAG: sugar phosphate isomerase/epimerase family protein [Armatimonadota bacterium]